MKKVKEVENPVADPIAELVLDAGRADINEIVAKINEIIKKLNERLG